MDAEIAAEVSRILMWLISFYYFAKICYVLCQMYFNAWFVPKTSYNAEADWWQ